MRRRSSTCCHEIPPLRSCELFPMARCLWSVSRNSNVEPSPRRSPRMLPPVWRVLPLENHSATPSEFVGSKKRRVPYCARASLDAELDSAQLCSKVVFQFLRSSVWPYEASATPPTRKFFSL